jgi:hypothetical protein
MPATSALVASTTTPLGANATWTSTPNIVTGGASQIVGHVFANVAGTFYIEQGPDGTFWDVVSSFTLTANQGLGFNVGVVAPYARARLVNGATAQGLLRAYVYLPHDTTAYVIQGP